MSRHVLLVYPRTGYDAHKPQTPLSVLSLVPGLEDAGVPTRVVDERVEPDARGALLGALDGALFLGLSAMTGHQLGHALGIARSARARAPQLPLVWGGVHPSLVPEQTLRHPLVDMVVVGEGEQTVVELARALRSGDALAEIQGLAWKDADGLQLNPPRPLADLAALPTPPWERVDLARYAEITVQTGRGCPFGCRFCYNQRFNERRWRPRPLPAILEEIALLAKLGARAIHFVDDNFFSDPGRAWCLLERMVESGAVLPWNATARADIVAELDEGQAALLRRAGLELLFVGCESGSQRVLDSIHKGISVQQVEAMARSTARHDLPAMATFMLGLPGETAADRALTFDLMDRMLGSDPALSISQLCMYTPYPGTDMFVDAVDAGFVAPTELEGWGRFSFLECNLPWLDPREQERLADLAAISRFVFWHREMKADYLRLHHLPAYWALRASALVRWRLRRFGHAWEWRLFRRAVGL